MISRVAESCFWLNRQMERVECQARLLAVNLAFQLDSAELSITRWRPLVVVAGGEEDFTARVGAAHLDDPERVQTFLTWDADNPVSVRSALGAARENARTTRETVSLEMWESLNELWLWLHERPTRRLYDRDRYAFYLEIRDRCMLFHGVAQATMLHEEPFDFMRLGTALERVGQTARTLDVKYQSLGPASGGPELPAESAQWLATLRSCSAVEAFFKRSANVLGGPAVAAFLLFERTFPRSILHNLDRAWNFLRRILPEGAEPRDHASAELLLALLREFEELEEEIVLEPSLHAVLDRAVDGAAAVCSAVAGDFFAAHPRTEPARPGGPA